MNEDVIPGKRNKIAAYLLKIKAVQISIDRPFNWSSGWKSPIYCDNRITLSYPEVRNAIRDAFVERIQTSFPHVYGIAGVATGGIAHAMLVADALNLPMVYIRSKAKEHGMKKQVEGHLETGKPYLVIEDLVSTGRSSLIAVKGLEAAGAEVAHTLAIFSYGFPLAEEAFEQAGHRYSSLTNLEALMAVAEEMGHITPDHRKILLDWQKNPELWQNS